MMPTILLERDRRSLLDELLLERSVWGHVVTLVGTTIVFGAVYGYVLGSWHGPQLATYAAIKIPLVMLSTAAVTALFSWIVAALLGVHGKIPEKKGLQTQARATRASRSDTVSD